MKKFLSFVLAMAILILISGCQQHTHVFTEATCTAPKTCVECGAVEGEVLPHNFTEASCTAPKTCVECGAVEGETTGHSVSFGRCERCHLYINIHLLEEIKGILDDAESYQNIALNYISGNGNMTDLNRLYRNYCEAVVYFHKYQHAIEVASDICSQYPELRRLQNKIDALIKFTLKNPKSADIDHLIDFLTDVETFASLQVEIYEELLDIAESFS